MKELKSTRTALGDALVELADSGADIAAVAADTSKSMCTDFLSEKYPERSFDCGIAEQNMMMIAAGLAASGKITFAASYSVFTSMRVTEQLRTFVCYPNLNVNVLAGIGGLSGGIEGATHMALEDLGVVRCLPGLTVLNPADYYSTKKAVMEAAKIDGPTYIRVGRDDSPVIFDDNYKLTIGKANVVIDEGDDIGIIVSGIILHYVLEAAKRLKEEGFGIRLIEMPTIKPIDDYAIIEMADKVRHLFTVEEHNVTGGLNTAVCEVLSRSFPRKVFPIATDDIYGESGSPSELAALYGLDGEGIYKRVKKFLKDDKK